MAKFRLAFCTTLLMLCLAGCRESILHDLSERDANRIQVCLESFGIAVEKRREGGRWEIAVERSSAIRALNILEQEQVMPELAVAIGVPEKGFLPSREEQKLYREEMLRASLEKTLLEIPSVRRARLHLSLPDEDPLRRPGVTGTAGVLLILKMPSQIERSQIQTLVSGATGIEPSRVSVVIEQLHPTASQKQVQLAKAGTVASEKPGLKRLTNFSFQVSRVRLSFVMLLLASSWIVLRIKKQRQKCAPLLSPEVQDAVRNNEFGSTVSPLTPQEVAASLAR